MKNFAAVVAVVLLLAVTPALGMQPDPTKCALCGMEMAKYPHTRYTITKADGKTMVTCGVQCGLTAHIRLGDAWKSATATDLFTNKQIDAKDATLVHGSRIITDMSPGFIAFKAREHGEKFAEAFGGKVMNYAEALELWRQRKK